VSDLMLSSSTAELLLMEGALLLSTGCPVTVPIVPSTFFDNICVISLAVVEIEISSKLEVYQKCLL